MKAVVLGMGGDGILDFRLRIVKNAVNILDFGFTDQNTRSFEKNTKYESS
jgi:hypothetical protein